MYKPKDPLDQKVTSDHDLNGARVTLTPAMAERVRWLGVTLKRGGSCADGCMDLVMDLYRALVAGDEPPSVVTGTAPVGASGTKPLGARRLLSVTDGVTATGALRTQPLVRMIDGAKFLEIAMWTAAGGGIAMYFGASAVEARLMSKLLADGADDLESFTGKKG